MIKKTILVLSTFALLSGSSCYAKQNISQLFGEWNIAEINGTENHNSKLMLGFNTKEHRIYGNSGCNTFFALIRNANSKKISFGAMGSTRMACQENDNYEFIKAVAETTSYKINKTQDRVELKNDKKETVLVLSRDKK